MEVEGIKLGNLWCLPPTSIFMCVWEVYLESLECKSVFVILVENTSEYFFCVLFYQKGDTLAIHGLIVVTHICLVCSLPFVDIIDKGFCKDVMIILKVISYPQRCGLFYFISFSKFFVGLKHIRSEDILFSLSLNLFMW